MISQYKNDVKAVHMATKEEDMFHVEELTLFLGDKDAADITPGVRFSHARRDIALHVSHKPKNLALCAKFWSAAKTVQRIEQNYSWTLDMFNGFFLPLHKLNMLLRHLSLYTLFLGVGHVHSLLSSSAYITISSSSSSSSSSSTSIELTRSSISSSTLSSSSSPSPSSSSSSSFFSSSSTTSPSSSSSSIAGPIAASCRGADTRLHLLGGVRNKFQQFGSQFKYYPETSVDEEEFDQDEQTMPILTGKEDCKYKFILLFFHTPLVHIHSQNARMNNVSIGHHFITKF